MGWCYLGKAGWFPRGPTTLVPAPTWGPVHVELDDGGGGAR